MNMIELNESVLCLEDGTRTPLPATLLNSTVLDDIAAKVKSWASLKGLVSAEAELCILY